MIIQRITEERVLKALLKLAWVREDHDLKIKTGLSFEHASVSEIEAIFESGIEQSISFVARDSENDEIQGFLLGEHYDRDTIYLGRLLVSPQRRKERIGEGLVNAFIHSDEARYRHCVVETASTNNPAIRIFQLFGFVADIDESSNDWLIMKRPPQEDLML